MLEIKALVHLVCVLGIHVDQVKVADILWSLRLGDLEQGGILTNIFFGERFLSSFFEVVLKALVQDLVQLLKTLMIHEERFNPALRHGIGLVL